MRKILAIAFFVISSIYSINVAISKESYKIGYSTRVIVHSDEKRVSFPVKNLSSKPVLFHGQVLDKDKNNFSQYFILTPEVTHLNADEEKWLQIINIGKNFPEDRESLLFLKGHFVPSSEKETTSAIKFSYAITMKLFYRPKHLRAEIDAIDDNVKKLNFHLVANDLVIKNESPFFMTINTLSLDGKEVHLSGSSSMIEPFGTQKLEIQDKKPKTVTWTLVNDGGYSTVPITRNL